MQAQKQILNSGLNITTQQAKEYHFNSISAAYSNVTKTFKDIIPQWIELQGNLNQLLKNLESAASAVKQKDVFSIVTTLSSTNVAWTSVQSNSRASLTEMDQQSSNLNGDFMYEGSPVDPGAKYLLSFSGNQYLNSNSGMELSNTSTTGSSSNPSFIWQFTKYKAGFYYMTTEEKTTQKMLYMFGGVGHAKLQFVREKSINGGLWRFVHKANSQDWCLTNAQLMFNAPGNYLSLNNTTVEVGQTQLFNQNPETITIHKI